MNRLDPRLREARERKNNLFEQGRYQEALDACLEITRMAPNSSEGWGDAAIVALRLKRWQDTVQFGQTAVSRGYDRSILDNVLSHAYGELGQWDLAGRYGLQALEARDRQFGGEPIMPVAVPEEMPPQPSAERRDRNVISFSLFGRDSKYCEPAILNVEEQPRIYPDWTCRFYVDSSVPKAVIDRLRTGGAQIVGVSDSAANWPKPMWRFLALDDSTLDRVLFRDADSVISQREARAVEAWLVSDKRFHTMRDSGSHTDLLLAGLWGAVAGSLPPMDRLVSHFMGAAIGPAQFADQKFLREYVWPYARSSLMQHDSIFGFMGADGFPDRDRPENFHVGSGECVESAFRSGLPTGSEVTWSLYHKEKGSDGQNSDRLICSYTNIVNEGVVRAPIPRRYWKWVEQGTAYIRL